MAEAVMPRDGERTVGEAVLGHCDVFEGSGLCKRKLENIQLMKGVIIRCYGRLW